MRNENRQILTNGLMTGSLISTAQPIDNMLCFCVQAFWTGTTPVGALGVQVSNLPNPQTAADWTLLAAPAPVSVAGDIGSVQINFENAGFRWVRAVYAFTSGTGTMQIWFNGKGGS